MRMLHTMIRVGDLERSLRFYCDVLGMKLLRRKDYESGRFTLAFVGYGDETEAANGRHQIAEARKPYRGHGRYADLDSGPTRSPHHDQEDKE